MLTLKTDDELVNPAPIPTLLPLNTFIWECAIIAGNKNNVQNIRFLIFINFNSLIFDSLLLRLQKENYAKTNFLFAKFKNDI